MQTMANQEVQSAQLVNMPAVASTPDLLFSRYAPRSEIFPAELKTWSFPSCPKTEYSLVEKEGQTVLYAKATHAASSIRKEVDINPLNSPIITWQWKVEQLIAGADNTEPDKEDSPARIVLTFDGDRSKFSFGELARSQFLKMLTGEELPYATIMYIWENRLPIGTIIESTHSKRIKMIVVASGSQDLGKWVHLNRNIAEDYRHAFGEEPGPLRTIGVMTDSNKTGSVAEAYYGDIRLIRAEQLAAQQSNTPIVH